MGFLSPFKSIWDDIAGEAVGAVKTVGNLGSLGIGNITGNQQEANNARTALGNSVTNLAHPAAELRNLGPDLSNVAQNTYNTGQAIATGIAQPIVGASEDYASFFGNLGNQAAGGPSMTGSQILGDNPLTRFGSNNNPNQIGTLHHTLSDWGQVGLDTVTGGIDGAVEKAAAPTLAKAVGEKAAGRVIKATVGAPVGAAYNSMAAAGNNESTQQVEDAAKLGAVIGGAVGGVLPGKTASPEAAAPGVEAIDPKAAAEAAQESVNPNESQIIDKNKMTPEQEAEIVQGLKDKLEPKPTPQPTDVTDSIKQAIEDLQSGKIDINKFNQIYHDTMLKARDINGMSPDPQAVYDHSIASGLDHETASALGNLADQYRDLSVPGEHLSAQDILGRKEGREANIRSARDVANKAITKFLGGDKGLLQDYRDLMEGVKLDHPTDPRVASLVKVSKPLSDHVFKYHEKINNAKYVDNYAARFNKFGRQVGAKVKGFTRAVKDTLGLDTSSRHSMSREYQKFVPEEGEHGLIGAPSEFGLHHSGDDPTRYVDGNGKIYHSVPTSMSELEEHGVADYEKSGAAITSKYHANTAKMVARQNAIDELIHNPGSEVIHVGEADVPAGYRAFVGVKGLEGYAAPAKLVPDLERQLGKDSHSSVAGALYDKTTGFITRTIVANPAFHGLNQYIQAMIAAGKTPLFDGGKMHSGIVGMIRLNAQIVRLATDHDALARWTAEYHDNGFAMPDYGAFTHGKLYDNLNRIHIGGLTKLSTRSMYELERMFRVAAFKDGIEHGMKAKDVGRNIEHYLGDSHSMGQLANRTLLFSHYAKTMSGALTGAVRHPLAEGGATLNAVTLWSAYQAINVGWQEYTGNPNASTRKPGELGFAESVVKSFADPKELVNAAQNKDGDRMAHLKAAFAGGQVERGQVPSVIRSHINPIVSFGVQEGTNRDLSKPVAGPQAATNVIRGPNGDSTKDLALRTLFGPGSAMQNSSSGKESLGENLLGYLGGTYTPHVKGYQAAPSGNADWLNKAGAKPGIGEQVTSYFNARDAGAKALSDPQDARNLDLYNSYFARNKTEDGKSILLAPAETHAENATLASNPKVLAQIQKLQTHDKNHDPQWDLSGTAKIHGQDGKDYTYSKMQLYLAYKSLAPGDLQRKAIAQQNPWIAQTEKDSAAWEQANVSAGNAVAGPGYIPFPVNAPDVQAKLDQLDAILQTAAADRTQDQRDALNALYADPDVIEAFHKSNVYTNAVREQMGVTDIPGKEVESPEVQAGWDAYNALPQHDGKKGGNVARFLWTQAHPDIWNKMSQNSENQALAGVEKYGGEAYYGATVPGSFLGDIHSLGKYDIAQIKDAKGHSTYALTDFTGSGGVNENGLKSVDLATSKAAGTGSSSSSSSFKPYTKYASSTGYGPSNKYLPNGARNPNYVNKHGYSSADAAGKFLKLEKTVKIKASHGGNLHPDNYLTKVRVRGGNPKRLKLHGGQVKISRGK